MDMSIIKIGRCNILEKYVSKLIYEIDESTSLFEIEKIC